MKLISTSTALLAALPCLALAKGTLDERAATHPASSPNTGASKWSPPSKALPDLNSTSSRIGPAKQTVIAYYAFPRWVVYWDQYLSAYNYNNNNPTIPSVSTINQFNTVILAFLLPAGAADQAQAWTWLPQSTRDDMRHQYHLNGIALMVSALGATEAPTTQGYNAVSLGKKMAAWVIQYGMDGIDVDYEDMQAMNLQNGKAEQWLTDFTKTLRAALPAPYILTHAPVAPWFSKANYPTGAYATVHKNVGNLIDWYNVQFYNQGKSEYTTCNNLLYTSSQVFPASAVFQIASAVGVPLSKIVIGKPGNPTDADSGYMSDSLLASCLSQAKSNTWNAGAMFWEFNHANNTGMKIVRSKTWPK